MVCRDIMQQPGQCKMFDSHVVAYLEQLKMGNNALKNRKNLSLIPLRKMEMMSKWGGVELANWRVHGQRLPRNAIIAFRTIRERRNIFWVPSQGLPEYLYFYVPLLKANLQKCFHLCPFAINAFSVSDASKKHLYRWFHTKSCHVVKQKMDVETHPWVRNHVGMANGMWAESFGFTGVKSQANLQKSLKPKLDFRWPFRHWLP